MVRQVSTIKQLSSLKFEELLAIKAKLEAVIDERIRLERQRLRASLKRLDAIAPASGAKAGSAQRSRAKERVLAIKYRNPANPNEVWAGRGLRPRWLVAALKGGKRKLVDFAVRS